MVRQPVHGSHDLADLLAIEEALQQALGDS
jgi:hypothetical protein